MFFFSTELNLCFDCIILLFLSNHTCPRTLRTDLVYIYAESETWMTSIPHTHTTHYTPNIWLRYSIKILFISITYTRNAGHVLQEMYVLHNVYVDELKQQK